MSGVGRHRKPCVDVRPPPQACSPSWPPPPYFHLRLLLSTARNDLLRNAFRNMSLVLLPSDICCNCIKNSCIYMHIYICIHIYIYTTYIYIYVYHILKYIIYLLSQFYVLRVLDLVLEGILIHETSAVVFIYCFSCLSIDQPLTQQKYNRNTRVLQGSLYYQSKQGPILGGNPSKTTIHLHYLNPPTMIHNGYSNLMIPVLKHHHAPIQWLWSSLPGQNCRVSAKCLWRANLGTLKT